LSIKFLVLVLVLRNFGMGSYSGFGFVMI
jgi:hypothetical protein